MNEKFSAVEKSDMSSYLTIDGLKKKFLNRKKTYKLSVENQFVEKFSSKLSNYLENNENFTIIIRLTLNSMLT